MNIIIFDITVDTNATNGLYFIQDVNQSRDTLDRRCMAVYIPMIKLEKQVFIYPEGVFFGMIDSTITNKLYQYFSIETVDSISKAYNEGIVYIPRLINIAY